jgi:hypothetical protein
MPVHIKLIVSALALIVVGGFSYSQLDGPNPGISYVGMGLAALMVLAIWIFPETGRKKSPDKN